MGGALRQMAVAMVSESATHQLEPGDKILGVDDNLTDPRAMIDAILNFGYVSSELCLISFEDPTLLLVTNTSRPPQL